jgi:hypothetical protein
LSAARTAACLFPFDPRVTALGAASIGSPDIGLEIKRVLAQVMEPAGCLTKCLCPPLGSKLARKRPDFLEMFGERMLATTVREMSNLINVLEQLGPRQVRLPGRTRGSRLAALA